MVSHVVVYLIVFRLDSMSAHSAGQLMLASAILGFVGA
jgi:hypothetical protein